MAQALGRRLPLSVRKEYQRTVDGARAALGEAAFAAAWAAGRALSPEEAVAEALDETREAGYPRAAEASATVRWR